MGVWEEEGHCGFSEQEPDKISSSRTSLLTLGQSTKDNKQALHTSEPCDLL